jgi:hypothetical protein
MLNGLDWHLNAAIYISEESILTRKKAPPHEQDEGMGKVEKFMTDRNACRGRQRITKGKIAWGADGIQGSSLELLTENPGGQVRGAEVVANQWCSFLTFRISYPLISREPTPPKRGDRQEFLAKSYI